MNQKITNLAWMKIAEQIGTFSTCKIPVGCILVQKNTIVGHGYVGSVHGDDHCDEDGHIDIDAPHRGKNRVTCIRTVHAELNAILKCDKRGSKETGWITSYSTHQPCLECLKALLQVGVRTMVYHERYDDYRRDKFVENSKLFDTFYCSGEEVARFEYLRERE